MDNEKMETEEQSNGETSEKMETGSPKGEPANKRIFETGKYDFTETIQPHIKIAVIGHSGCGKSSLILAAKDAIFPHPNEKYVSRRHHLDVVVDETVEKCMVAEIDDWGAVPDIRKKFYSEKDVIVLLCFNDTCWMKDLEKKWKPELQKYKVPVILVKILKELKEGKMCRAIMDLEGLSDYIECCPHAKAGVQEVFQEAVKRVQSRRIKK